MMHVLIIRSWQKSIVYSDWFILVLSLVVVRSLVSLPSVPEQTHALSWTLLEHHLRIVCVVTCCVENAAPEQRPAVVGIHEGLLLLARGKEVRLDISEHLRLIFSFFDFISLYFHSTLGVVLGFGIFLWRLIAGEDIAVGSGKEGVFGWFFGIFEGLKKGFLIDIG